MTKQEYLDKVQRLKDTYVCDSDVYPRLCDLDDDYIESLEAEIARLKTMSLDEFCLWQKGIQPVKAEQVNICLDCGHELPSPDNYSSNDADDGTVTG